jgi:hypothetical protein
MSGSLVLQIAIGIVAGVALSLIAPQAATSAMLLGNLFVQALKAVAPVLVLVLVASAIANRRASHTAQLRPIVFMYLVGTFAAALLAVTVSALFPTTLVLQVSEVSISAPQGIAEVLGGLLQRLVDNPVNAVLTGNYIGILVWGVLLGIFLHHAADSTRQLLADIADAVTHIVRIVIRLAPIGIFGLVAGNLAESGLSVLGSYARILTVLLGCMVTVALFINPLIVWVKTRRNPYPIVFAALRESGVTALRGFNPAGGDHQHGWCGDYHYSADTRGDQYAGYQHRLSNGVVAQPRCSAVGVRRVGGGGWIIAADSAQLCFIRHLERYCNASGCCRFRDQYFTGLRRDCLEQFDGCCIYGSDREQIALIKVIAQTV